MFRKIFRTSTDAYKQKLEVLKQNPDGAEDLDTTPMAPPIGFVKQPSMVEHIRSLIRSEKLRLEAEEAGAETFEESEDFDVEDDLEPISPFEFERYFDPGNHPAPPPPEGRGNDVVEKEPPVAEGGSPQASGGAKPAQ